MTMAAFSGQPVRVGGQDRVMVAGSFAPNGSSAIDATKTYGKGFTAAYTTTGTFTVTLTDVYGQLDSATATLQLATAADQIAMIGAYTAASKTIIIYVWDISDAALSDNVTANTNNRINFCLIFRNSGSE